MRGGPPQGHSGIHLTRAAPTTRALPFAKLIFYAGWIIWFLSSAYAMIILPDKVIVSMVAGLVCMLLGIAFQVGLLGKSEDRGA